jgi:hypothetical protein
LESYTREARFLTRWDQHTDVNCSRKHNWLSGGVGADQPWTIRARGMLVFKRIHSLAGAVSEGPARLLRASRHDLGCLEVSGGPARLLRASMHDWGVFGIWGQRPCFSSVFDTQSYNRTAAHGCPRAPLRPGNRSMVRTHSRLAKSRTHSQLAKSRPQPGLFSLV